MKKEKQIEIKGSQYTIKYPDVGALFQIESMKQRLANNSYQAIVSSFTRQSEYTRYLIDMVSVFNVLLPNLTDELKVGSIMDLDVEDANELLKVYLKDVKPWFDEWLQTQHEVINMIHEEKADEEKKIQQEKRSE